jgi:hypothetical protein
VAERQRTLDEPPVQENMRGDRRLRAKPTEEDKKIKRRQRRTPRTAVLKCAACGCQGRSQAVCPCGLKAYLDPMDGWSHLDGSVSHSAGLKTCSELLRDVHPMCPYCGSLAVEAAYGEGSQMPVVRESDFPHIDEELTRKKSPFDDFMGGGFELDRSPGGFDEPFQQDRYMDRQKHFERFPGNQLPKDESPGWITHTINPNATPEEIKETAEGLARQIGPPSTTRQVSDAPRDPKVTPDQAKLQWFKDKWSKTTEPLGFTDEGRARIRRNTRDRYSKVVGPPACDHPNCPPWEHNEGRQAARTAAWGTWGDDYAPTDWDEHYPKGDSGDIHRSIKVYPDFELWKHMGGSTGLSHEEVAHKVLDHVRKHPNLGMHWTSDLDHAHRVARAGNWGQGRSWYRDQEKEAPESDLGAAVIVHAKWPKREHIETDPDTLRRYNVGPYDDGESEVPIKTGTPLHVTGISWSQYDTPHPRDFTHHTFQGVPGHQAKLATVIDTQVERLTKGNHIRTPQGQLVEILGPPRPHETHGGKVYVDTSAGTTLMDRGTSVQVVPHNSQQQELPNSGSPTGNSGELPGSGRTPSGQGGSSEARPAPRCPSDGAKMILQGNEWICPVDGTKIPANANPVGMNPSNRPNNQLVQPDNKQPVRQTHLWASLDQPSLIARRAQQVLDMEGSTL